MNTKDYCIRVIKATHIKGITQYHQMNEYSIKGADIQLLTREADILQDEFDSDCDPVRVYVCNKGVPFYAGRQHIAVQFH